MGAQTIGRKVHPDQILPTQMPASKETTQLESPLGHAERGADSRVTFEGLRPIQGPPSVALENKRVTARARPRYQPTTRAGSSTRKVVPSPG
jgi:hypothetical protein